MSVLMRICKHGKSALQILRFPRNDGLLMGCCLIPYGEIKTLRHGASNVFGIHRHPNPELCPVKTIETYVAVASELRDSLTNGCLFQPTNHQGLIVNKPFTSSSAEARLKLHLKEAQIDELGRNTAQLPFGLGCNIGIIWLPVGEHHVSCRMKQQRNCPLLHETGEGASYRQSLSFVTCRLFCDICSNRELHGN